MPQNSVRGTFPRSRGDAAVIVGAAVAGLAAWFLYVAVQPRDYALPLGSAHRLNTLFGWRAPGIDPRDFIERDRIFVAMVGWLVIGVVAGRLRPMLWPYIGPATMLPVLLVFFSTSPHDAQGWWVFNVVYLPVLAGVVSAAALGASRVRFPGPVLCGCLLGVLVAAAFLTGGGESTAVVVVGAGLASGFIGAALALADPATRRS